MLSRRWHCLLLLLHRFTRYAPLHLNEPTDEKRILPLIQITEDSCVYSSPRVKVTKALQHLFLVLVIQYIRRIYSEAKCSKKKRKKQKKLQAFAHICRMSDSRKIKLLVFGIMDGNNQVGRPHRELVDNIVDWNKAVQNVVLRHAYSNSVCRSVRLLYTCKLSQNV